jgi:hypothetical protein
VPYPAEEVANVPGMGYSKKKRFARRKKGSACEDEAKALKEGNCVDQVS